MKRYEIKTLKRWLPRGSFAYNVSLLAGSTAVGQLVGVLAAPLLTRLYTPEDYGVLGVYLSVFSLLNVVSSLRYEFAVNLAENDSRAADILGLVLGLVTFSSLVLLIVVLLLGQPLADWLNAPALGPYLWLLPLSLFGAGVYTAFNYWSLRFGSFAALGRTRVTQSVSATMISLVLGVLVGGPFGLLVSHVTSQSVGTGTLVRLSWRQHKGVLRGISLGGMVQVARRYVQFALLTSASALVNTAGAQVPRLLMSGLYGAAVIGWFTFSQRIFAIPMSLIGTSVGQVFLSDAARLARENPPELRRFFFKTARRLLLLGLFPAAVLMLFGGPLFAFVFGPEWETAGLYTQILAPAFLIQFVVSSVSQVMIVVQQARLQLIWDVVRLAVVGGVFAAAVVFGLSDQQAIVMYALALILTYGILFVLQWKSLNRFIERGPSPDETTTNAFGSAPL